MLYLDAASDRMEQAHVSRIEEIRVATIFASDRKAHDKWRQRPKRGARGIVGDALEQAVMGIAAMFPGNVVRGTV